VLQVMGEGWSHGALSRRRAWRSLAANTT
jgi:hypothetical protein